MAYFFSPQTLSFYDDSMRDAYEAAGTWPKDAVEVSDEEFREFGCGSPPDGKQRGKKGKKPAWVDYVPTDEQRLANLKASVLRVLDVGAVSLGFDSMQEALTYVDEDSVPTYQAQAKALRAWRSLCWSKFDELVAKWKGGQADAPTADELAAALPGPPGAEITQED